MTLNYRAIAVDSGDPIIDKMGWDDMAEGLAETVYLEDVRTMWKRYHAAMMGHWNKGETYTAGYYAWVLIYIENEVAKRSWL